MFQHAVDKYGNVIEEFEHYILAPDGENWLLWDKNMSISDTNHFDSNEASELEAMWIEIYDALDYKHGFNRQSGGDQGFVVSEQAKEYMSEIMTGRYVGKHNPFFGQHHNKETRLRLSELATQRTGAKSSFYGKHHTKETKERQRKAKKGLYDGENNPFYGQHHSEKTKILLSEQQSKPISMYTLDGQYVKSFPYALIAAQEMGVAVQSISMCATKATKSACGMIWRYFECPQLLESDLPQKHALCKNVAQYSLQGEFIRTFDSLTEAAESANTTITSISKCVNGPHKQAGGYIWRDYVCEHIPANELPVPKCRAVAQYDAQGNLIKTFRSLKEAATALGVTPEAICNAAKGKVKTCAGYILKYSQE
ncbi:MAG: hypothetical protein IKT68_04475 [Clostridia bacterium]|nr:hypothetical protein [Clostridia bacterium]